MSDDSSLSLTGCELRGNNALWGGAICSSNIVQLKRTILKENFAVYSGGALYLSTTNSRKVNIWKSKFRQNVASISGGAAHFTFSWPHYSMDITDSEFAKNQVIGFSGNGRSKVSDAGAGGAIVASVNSADAVDSFEPGVIHIYNSNFTRNQAYGGGGALATAARAVGSTWHPITLRLSTSHFQNNKASEGSGGAMQVSEHTCSSVLISGSTFNRNHADDLNGGALEFVGVNHTLIEGSVFNGNTAARQAGACRLEGGSSHVSNSTFTNNLGVLKADVFELTDHNMLLINGTRMSSTKEYNASILDKSTEAADQDRQTARTLITWNHHAWFDIYKSYDLQALYNQATLPSLINSNISCPKGQQLYFRPNTGITEKLSPGTTLGCSLCAAGRFNLFGSYTSDNWEQRQACVACPVHTHCDSTGAKVAKGYMIAFQHNDRHNSSNQSEVHRRSKQRLPRLTQQQRSTRRDYVDKMVETGTERHFVTFICNNVDACPESNAISAWLSEDGTTCAEGYSDQGCLVCDIGYGRKGDTYLCEKCPSSVAFGMFMIIFFQSIIYVLYWWSAVTCIGHDESDMSVLLKILSANSVVLAGLKSVPWWQPLGLNDMLGLGAAFGGSDISAMPLVTTLDCILNRDSSGNTAGQFSNFTQIVMLELVIALSSFVIGTVCSMAVAVSGRKLLPATVDEGEGSKHTTGDDVSRMMLFWQAWQLSCYVAIYTCLPLLVQAALRPFPCTRTKDLSITPSRMLYAQSVECNSADHWHSMLLGCAGLVATGLLFYLFYSKVISLKAVKEEEALLFSFFSNGYKDGCLMTEVITALLDVDSALLVVDSALLVVHRCLTVRAGQVIVLARKCWILGAITINPGSNGLLAQVVLVMLVLVPSFGHHMNQLPFNSTRMTNLEAFSLVASCLTELFAVWVVAANDTTGTRNKRNSTRTIFSTFVAFFVYLGFYAYFISRSIRSGVLLLPVLFRRKLLKHCGSCYGVDRRDLVKLKLTFAELDFDG